MTTLYEEDKRCVTTIESIVPTIQFETFVESKYFTKVCDVVEDVETRKTKIRFDPVISKDEWKKHSEWIYVITCDNLVVKIGGTRTGLLGRTQSYLCGRPEFRKKGTCSTTNYVLYTSLLALVEKGHKVEMYAKKLKPYVINVSEFEQEVVDVPVQIYHVFETKMMESFKKQFGNYPVLSANCDKRFK